MFPVQNGVNLFSQDHDNYSAFPLWGRLLFPRDPLSIGTAFPLPLNLPTELTMSVNSWTQHDSQTPIRLRPIVHTAPSTVSDVDVRVPGLMFLYLQFGWMRFGVVLCTKEEGFPKGSQLELPTSWTQFMRQDTTNANVDGKIVRRQIRCGDEIVLRKSSVPESNVGKKEPLDLSLDSKPSSDNTGEFAPSHTGFSCSRCGKVFSYSYYRDKHLKYTRCVDNGDRKFPCPICPRSFEKKDRLRIHILHVHENHRPHLCSVCGKAFSQSSSLNKHLRVHSGDRPYKCLFCAKAFTASSILRTHMRQHSGEKPFKCAHCGRPFASHAAHDSHVRRNHGPQKR